MKLRQRLADVYLRLLKIASLAAGKTQNVQPKKQKKNDENGKNLSFDTCNFIDGNFISWRLDARISPKLQSRINFKHIIFRSAADKRLL